MRPLPDNTGLIGEVHADSAEDLLDLLSPQRGGPLWRNVPGQGAWIFRGQADADWDLTPSALRGGDPWHKFRPGQRTVIPRTDPQEIIDNEETFVIDFANRAATLGYELPFDSAVIRDKDRVRLRNDANDFPLSEYRGIWALAQHYGVPTRLLDWTTRPLIAAYFASIDVARKQVEDDASPTDKRIAIWALNRQFVDMCCRDRGGDLPGIVTVTVPKHTNPNLAAQSGLFTLVRFKNGPTRLPPSLDAVMRSDDLLKAARETRGITTLPRLYKLTCPQSDVRFLLHYLHLSGIDAASIYSGHGSIERAMQEGGYRSVIGRENRFP